MMTDTSPHAVRPRHPIVPPRWQVMLAAAGLLTRGSLENLRLPGCPVAFLEISSPLTVAGAVSAFTEFPIIPSRGP